MSMPTNEVAVLLTEKSRVIIRTKVYKKIKMFDIRKQYLKDDEWHNTVKGITFKINDEITVNQTHVILKTVLQFFEQNVIE